MICPRGVAAASAQEKCRHGCNLRCCSHALPGWNPRRDVAKCLIRIVKRPDPAFILGRPAFRDDHPISADEVPEQLHCPFPGKCMATAVCCGISGVLQHANRQQATKQDPGRALLQTSWKSIVFRPHVHPKTADGKLQTLYMLSTIPVPLQTAGCKLPVLYKLSAAPAQPAHAAYICAAENGPSSGCPGIFYEYSRFCDSRSSRQTAQRNPAFVL